MKKKIDDLGRIVIPQPFRDELGIEPNQEIEVDKVGNKIVITNPKGMKTKEEIEKMYEDIKKLAKSEYDKGFIDSLKMVLNK